MKLFRKYQKLLFGMVTFFVISSFIFLGTFSTFSGSAQQREDRKVGKLLQGSSFTLLEVQKLSRFLDTDQEDLFQKRRSWPNLCNNGVIRVDFLQEGLAELIVSAYFNTLKEDLDLRREKAKRFRPYEHPENSSFSAKAVWGYLVPELSSELEVFQKEDETDLSCFSHLSKLYQYQSQIKPEMLRQILMFQQKQDPSIQPDHSLAFQDLSLFGFYSASDWFGKHFVDLISQFILNTADLAEAKGYKVTLQEAKGDLIHIYQTSVEKLQKAGLEDEVGFHRHLQMLGFDEREASEVWRKVLLFRRYFEDVKESVFVDLLPLKEFAGYASETALLQAYRFPISVFSKDDVAALHFYIQSIAKDLKEGLPQSVLPLEEIEKKCPVLVQRVVKGKLRKVHRDQVALRISLKSLREWEAQHFSSIASKFSLPSEEDKDQRLELLASSSRKREIDAWARSEILKEHPEWIQEALALSSEEEKIWSLKGDETPTFSEEGWFSEIKDLETVKEKRLLSFHEAKPFLKAWAAKVNSPIENPFIKASQEAFASVQKEMDQSPWMQTGKDPVLDQFRLESREEKIQRSSKEDWMKHQAFMMLPNIWSPIHVSDGGEVVFFYLKEKKTQEEPILDRIVLAKETLGADAKLYAAEKLLQKVREKNAIVIPLQEEVE